MKKTKYFRGLKVHMNRRTLEVNLRISVVELQQLLTLASLQCYASEREAKADARRTEEQKAQSVAYYRGMLKFIDGAHDLIAARWHVAPPNLRVDPLTQPRSRAGRLAYVLRRKAEREMFALLLEGNWGP